MVHKEQVLVYDIVASNDGYGGATDEMLVLDTNAPTWATIEPVSGSQSAFLGGNPTNNVYNLDFNFKVGYNWNTGKVVHSALYGYVKVDSIVVSDRLRGIRLTGNSINGDQWQIASA